MKEELNYTIDQVAQIMGFSKGSVECFMISGILKSQEVSPGDYRVKQSDLDEFKDRVNKN
ncbi:helix-turn-helix domain-containing protein [Acetobacterium malicum]|uniref:Helix-turn-helix domain-containing protein n=1 Tax=Acetobacterium malicum TaxID=52692 RepID=A0ABR6Z2Y0_9FIRM|nr:helix-turn-helix domain-containing protein [Acetobacterium malicum]MBC3901551.1 helix-turn-helix domain-containing protein [Acetobacterium malicum]